MTTESVLHKLVDTIGTLDTACKKGEIDDSALDKAQKVVSDADARFQEHEDLINHLYIVHEAQGLIFWIKGDQVNAKSLLLSAADLKGDQSLYTESGTVLLGRFANPQSTGKKKIPAALISIVGIIVVYTIINVVLVGGQQLLHAQDQAKLDSLTSTIDSNKSSLTGLDSSITSQEEQLKQLKATMDNYQNSGQIDEYNSQVDNFNALRENYLADIDSYNTKLSSTNSMIDEANKLIDSIGSTYYLVPLPTGKHHG